MKRKLKTKNILILVSILLVIIIGVLLVLFAIPKKKTKKDNKPKTETKVKKPEVPKEKVDIINIESKTRPFAVVINNTPVAVKVQTGLNKAYIVYELPTEGATSRLMALFKDSDDVTIGTIRSARHNFIDYAYESNAILIAHGWSVYAESQLRNGAINYINAMIHGKPFWRKNPEHLASEHTSYTSINKLKDFAYNSMKYKKESDSASKTVLLKYNVSDTDLSKMEGVKEATEITIPYGNIVTKFKYDSEKKEYQRIVNGNATKDYDTKEAHTAKNIIVQKIGYGMMDNNYYWDLHTTGSGSGYYITNGYAVPIKWSKSDRKAKTKYTYLDGKEIEVSDGRTYIQVTVRNYTIK